jgi:Ferritin-like
VTNGSATEDPIVIETRDELIFMLSEAATLEHMIMCGYLFTSFTLKDRTDEGLSSAQSEAVKRWDRVISGVATQEMLHLALVNNLLTSIGAAPYFGRPNFPHPARYFAPDVQLALLPFGERALRHFLYLERPESFDVEDAPGFDLISAAVPNTVGDEIVPEAQSFSAVGDLYRGLENGFAHMVQKLGERRLFVGSARTQATQKYFGWPELVTITDLASSKRAIETIIIEGEGARGHWERAHFGKFYHVLNEYLEFKREDPTFEPARPAIPACVRPPSDMRKMAKITDPFTAGVSNLFNANYELALQLLCRFFMHTETTGTELQTLSGSAIGTMVQVLRPLGKLLTRLPVGEHHPGQTAGPSFEMYRKEYLLPHKDAAWVLLHERVTEQAEYCSGLAARAPEGFDLRSVDVSLEELSTALEPHALAGRRAIESG